MGFFEYLLGGAVLLGTGYLKAKEGMSCDDDDYKEMDSEEKMRELSSGLKNSLQKDGINIMNNYRKQIKNKNDDYILNAIRNLESQGKESDYRYIVLCEEANRRGI